MSGKPNTRLQSNLNKELQSRSKIPVKTPKSYIPNSVTNTSGYKITVLNHQLYQ